MRNSLARPLTYLITKGVAMPANFPRTKAAILEIVRSAAADGVSLIQIREKQLTARLLFELAAAAAAITRQTATKLLINERADIAIAAGADGVHLPASSIPAGVIRAAFPASFTIGVSAHSADEIKAARANGADFAVFGPVFETPGKGPATGLDELKRISAANAPFPVIALGGIDETNFRTALENGAVGIAAIRALNDAETRRRICAALSADPADLR